MIIILWNSNFLVKKCTRNKKSPMNIVFNVVNSFTISVGFPMHKTHACGILVRDVR